MCRETCHVLTIRICTSRLLIVSCMKKFFRLDRVIATCEHAFKSVDTGSGSRFQELCGYTGFYKVGYAGAAEYMTLNQTAQRKGKGWAKVINIMLKVVAPERAVTHWHVIRLQLQI